MQSKKFTTRSFNERLNVLTISLSNLSVALFQFLKIIISSEVTVILKQIFYYKPYRLSGLHLSNAILQHRRRKTVRMLLHIHHTPTMCTKKIIIQMNYLMHHSVPWGTK